jgi:hypothetical protein
MARDNSRVAQALLIIARETGERLAYPPVCAVSQ